MLEDSEWQPGRIAPASNRSIQHPLDNRSETVWNKSQGRIVHVRPVNPIEVLSSILSLRKVGCQSELFFEIKPEDWQALTGKDPQGCKKIMCEHCIWLD